MDRKLIEAAKKGDVEKLHDMIKDDPFLLRSTVFLDGDNPLHTACMAGSLDFVKQVLSLRPEFAVENNQHGFTPLAIAAANGDLEIVKEILKIGNHPCLVKGKESRIPLHYAVCKGRIQVLRELTSACLDSIFEVTARGENCFHLAVKNSQFEAFKVLIELVVTYKRDRIDVLNDKDGGGNTVLHHAASTKQYEVVDVLLDDNHDFKDTVDVNSLNKNGVTPLDVLISNGGDCEIEEMLRICGGSRIEEMNSLTQQVAISDYQNRPNNQSRQLKTRKPSQRLQDYFKYDKVKDSPSKVRNTLLILAVLIATATYQAVLSPPGGVWQDDFWPPINNSSAQQPPRHTAGQAVMGTNRALSYGMFLLFNSVGFFMSLQIIHFLTYGLPLQFELRVALFALIVTYDTCMGTIAPSSTIALFFIILSVLMPLIIAVLTVVVRDYKKDGPRSSTASA